MLAGPSGGVPTGFVVGFPSPRLGGAPLPGRERTRARMTTIRHGGIIFRELTDLSDDPWEAAAPLRSPQMGRFLSLARARRAPDS